MMKQLYQVTLIALFPILFLSFSCSNRTETSESIDVYKVDTDNTPTSLSEIAKTHRTIVLETSDQLVGQIRNISAFKDLLFIADDKQIFKYNQKGNFISSFGTQGEGPGEYRFLTSMAIDQNEQRIYTTSLHKVLVYDFDGDFMLEKKHPHWFDAILALNDNIALLNTEFGAAKTKEKGGINRTSLQVINNKLEVTDSVTIRSVSVKNNSAASLGIGFQFASNLGNESFLYYPVVYSEKISRDTLFSISNSTLTPTHKIDFGISDRSIEKFLITSMVRSRNYILVNFRHKSIAKQCLLDLRDGSFVTVNDGFEDTIFGTEKVKLKLWNADSDEFYFIKDAMEVHEVIDGMKMYDNPVITILTLN